MRFEQKVIYFGTFVSKRHISVRNNNQHTCVNVVFVQIMHLQVLRNVNIDYLTKSFHIDYFIYF